MEVKFSDIKQFRPPSSSLLMLNFPLFHNLAILLCTTFEIGFLSWESERQKFYEDSWRMKRWRLTSLMSFDRTEMWMHRVTSCTRFPFLLGLVDRFLCVFCGGCFEGQRRVLTSTRGVRFKKCPAASSPEN